MSARRAADRLVLLDDARARRFEPFALTRPIGSLRIGAVRQTDRWERVAGFAPAIHIAAAHLADYEEPGGRTVAGGSTLPAGTLLVNARSIPALDARAADADTVEIAGRVAAVRLRAETRLGALEEEDAIERLAGSRRTSLPGTWIDEVWDALGVLGETLAADVPALAGSLDVQGAPPNAIVIGNAAAIFIERGSVVEPGVVFDAAAGPILVRRHATVQHGTRLIGPACIGEHTTVLGDRLSGVSIGEWCKVRGEMSATVMLAYSNKGHDGFVGHSYLGSWVNLGAGTVTSNLKNTYGTVSLWTPEGVRNTGMQFLGTLFGDHVKTGIGLRLTTGCVLGAGANVFDRMPPKVVEPFAWGSAPDYERFELDRFLDVAHRVMARRHVELSDRGRGALRAAHAAAWRTAR